MPRSCKEDFASCARCQYVTRRFCKTYCSYYAPLTIVFRFLTHLNAHYHTAPGHCEVAVPGQSPWHYTNSSFMWQMLAGIVQNLSFQFHPRQGLHRYHQWNVAIRNTHTRRAHLDWLNQKQILIQTSDFVLYYTHTTLCHKPLSHVAVL